MFTPTRAISSPIARAYIAQSTRRASTHPARTQPPPPPPPRPFHRPPPPPLEGTTEAEEPGTPTAQPRQGPLRHIWPFSKGIAATPSLPPLPVQAANWTEPRDPERGRRAAEQVVRTGKLDERYRDPAKKVNRIIIAMPLVIYLGWVLWQRRFEGVEQKTFPRVRGQEELR